jgi:hypothetical protein
MEIVANALDLAAEAARHDLDEREKRRALALLEQADQADPLVAPVRRMLDSLSALPERPPRWPARTAMRVRDRYLRFAETRACTRLTTAVVVLWGASSLFVTFELVLSLGLHLGGAAPGSVSDDIGRLSVINWASLGSSTLSGVLVIVGVRELRRGRRMDAYRWFERALLVSIFITRCFAFVESQFGACFGLAVDLLLLATLGLMMKGERQRALEPAPAAFAPAGEPSAVGASTTA